MKTAAKLFRSMLALTPALSPAEMENRSPLPDILQAGDCALRVGITENGSLLFPLLGGEGHGEGGRHTFLKLIAMPAAEDFSD